MVMNIQIKSFLIAALLVIPLTTHGRNDGFIFKSYAAKKIAGLYSLQIDAISGQQFPDVVDSGVVWHIDSDGVGTFHGYSGFLGSNFSQAGQLRVLSFDPWTGIAEAEFLATISLFDPDAILTSECVTQQCAENVLYKGIFNIKEGTYAFKGVGTWFITDTGEQVTNYALNLPGERYFTVDLSGQRKGIDETKERFQELSIPLPTYP